MQPRATEFALIVVFAEEVPCMPTKNTELHAIRLANLERLVREVGTAAELARRCKTSSAYISQLRRGEDASGKQVPIGERIARKFEIGLNKPPGWLDSVHDGEDLAESNRTPLLAEGVHAVHCPVVSWVQAGEFTRSPESAVDPDSYLPCPRTCSDSTFALRVRGASMEPKFHEGDLIFVDPRVSPTSGRFVVVVLGSSEEATFKQYVQEDGKAFLRALNPAWPNRIIQLDEDAHICGVVIFRGEEV